MPSQVARKIFLSSCTPLCRKLLLKPYLIIARISQVGMQYFSVKNNIDRRLFLFGGEVHILRRNGSIRCRRQDADFAVRFKQRGLDVCKIKIALAAALGKKLAYIHLCP